jgi:hypothetical protein
MPEIRVMNWNIEQFSLNKVNIGGMLTALARTISAQNVDIVVLLEVKRTQVNNVMARLTGALNLLAAGGAPWVWFLSYATGGEYYGFLVRNLGLIRPLAYTNNADTDGTATHPFDNLRKLSWTTWPSNNWGALPNPLPARPRIGLTDVFMTPPRPGGRLKKIHFAGQPLGAGGYSLGRGYRLPCLALFHVHTGAGDYVIPIVACHFAAVRSGRNALAQHQVKQLPYLHIAQLFSYQDQELRLRIPPVPIPPPVAGYLNVNGQAHLLREICFTGDFNMNFLENTQAVGATYEQATNHEAYLALTSTSQRGGSAGPQANPGGQPQGQLPVVPFAGPFATGPSPISIPKQVLKAALTTRGSTLKRYPNQPPPVGAAFDNFFYGGTQLNTAALGFGVGGADSAEVVDVPTNIVQPGGLMTPEEIDLSAVYGHYLGKGTKNAGVPGVAALLGGAAALMPDARWIGARFLSDHLPVFLRFNCP